MQLSHDWRQKMPRFDVVISLGANTPGCWGAPAATLRRARQELERCGIIVVDCSQLFVTSPHIGAGLMPDFYNLAMLIRADMAIGSLMRRLKYIERLAGRRVRPRWSARPLDIDVIDYRSRVMNWPTPTRAGGPIVLPHPLMHQRGFVLVPLAEIAPHWRHPVLGHTAPELLARSPHLRRGVSPSACFECRSSILKDGEKGGSRRRRGRYKSDVVPT